MERLIANGTAACVLAHRQARPPRPLVTRLRFQFLGGLAFAVAAPALVHLGVGLSAPGEPNTIAGSAAALAGGLYLFRRLRSFPGAQAVAYLLTAFALAYLAVILAFFFLRMDYSRYQFISSFMLSLAWFLGNEFTVRRVSRLRLAVVPGGDGSRATTIDQVEWVRLVRPDHGIRQCAGIVADLRATLGPEWERFITECAVSGTPVFHVKQVVESLTGKVEIEHLSENTLGSLVPDLAYAKLKRLADFAAAVAILPLLLPLLIVVGAMIRLESCGPVLFRQERMGYRGRPFTVYKFRTMRQAETSPGGERALAITRRDDERITPLGRLLRRTRIDELPQVLNVLKGEMSFIGPRPEALVLSHWYEQELPFYRYRHVVRPGISGWAQINQGHVAEVDEVLEKLHYDFFYIKHFSPWLDVLIVIGTIRTVLTGFGAR